MLSCNVPGTARLFLRCCVFLLVALNGAAAAAPLAYIPVTSNRRATVVDAASITVAGAIELAGIPVGVAVDPSGRHAYFSLAIENVEDRVAVVDTSTNQLLVEVPAGDSIGGIATSLDGTRLYVSRLFEVRVFSTPSFFEIARIPIPGQSAASGDIAVNPVSGVVYKANFTDISVIGNANTVVDTIAAGGFRGGIAFNPTGTRAYVANPGGSVAVIDAQTHDVLSSIQLGGRPRGVAVSPSGSRLYVSNDTFDFGRGASMWVIDTATNAVLTEVRLPGGDNANAIDVTPSGSHVYVATEFSQTGNLWIIDSGTNAVVKNLVVVGRPQALGRFFGSPPPADVVATLASNSGSATEGGSVTFTATLVNQGPANTFNVQLRLELPGGAQPTSIIGSEGASCTSVAPIVCTWNGVTPAGATRSVIVVARFALGTAGSLSATAFAYAPAPDPAPNNNSAAVSIFFGSLGAPIPALSAHALLLLSLLLGLIAASAFRRAR